MPIVFLPEDEIISAANASIMSIAGTLNKDVRNQMRRIMKRVKEKALFGKTSAAIIGDKTLIPAAKTELEALGYTIIERTLKTKPLQVRWRVTW